MEPSSSRVVCLVLALAVAAATVAVRPCAAQNSPQDFVNRHNAARAAVGVGPRQGDCKLVHSGPNNQYGENLFWGSSGKGWTASDAVGTWVAERQYYDHGRNSCAAGKVCGHNTQVVWRDSTAIGCARVDCNNGGGVFITCNYNPPGNYVGRSPY
ncbi:unnamed protein product [Miscanthus lutarioriparius]|uniref:SCP domain-containing protein n=1 Tax=Miscanthus lutarioriparius TaxID=422564 RepID=A0A811NCM7_9POAL|nr:unnamed protein product [Miscanthus lutarioriparius]